MAIQITVIFQCSVQGAPRAAVGLVAFCAGLVGQRRSARLTATRCAEPLEIHVNR